MATRALLGEAYLPFHSMRRVVGAMQGALTVDEWETLTREWDPPERPWIRREFATKLSRAGQSAEKAERERLNGERTER